MTDIKIDDQLEVEEVIGAYAEMIISPTQM